MQSCNHLSQKKKPLKLYVILCITKRYSIKLCHKKKIKWDFGLWSLRPHFEPTCVKYRQRLGIPVRRAPAKLGYKLTQWSERISQHLELKGTGKCCLNYVFGIPRSCGIRKCKSISQTLQSRGGKTNFLQNYQNSGYISRSSTFNFQIFYHFQLKIQFPVDLNRIQTRNSSADKNPDFAGFLPQLATSDFLSIISLLLIIRGF